MGVNRDRRKVKAGALMRCFIFNGPVKASNDSSTLGSKVTHPLSYLYLPVRPLPLSYLLEVQREREGESEGCGAGAQCARSSAECECLVIKLEVNSTGLGILLTTVCTAE